MKYKEIHFDESLRNRFLLRAEEIILDCNECWKWPGAKTMLGYGTITSHGVRYLAHRVSFTYYNKRQIKESMVLDHTCSTRLCINPKHLQEISIADNIKVEYERFPDKYKNSYYKYRNTTILPKKLLLGFCKNNHTIESYSDMSFVDKTWKCKKCIKIWSTTNRPYNYSEKRKEYNKKWRLKNEEKIRLYQKEYRSNKKDIHLNKKTT